MTPEFVIDFSRKAMELALLISMPMLLVGLVVGLLVSIFQATTQIQEMTLQFIPKIILIAITIIIAGPWILEELMDYTKMILISFPDWIRNGDYLINGGLDTGI